MPIGFHGQNQFGHGQDFTPLIQPRWPIQQHMPPGYQHYPQGPRMPPPPVNPHYGVPGAPQGHYLQPPQNSYVAPRPRAPYPISWSLGPQVLQEMEQRNYAYSNGGRDVAMDREGQRAVTLQPYAVHQSTDGNEYMTPEYLRKNVGPTTHGTMAEFIRANPAVTQTETAKSNHVARELTTLAVALDYGMSGNFTDMVEVLTRRMCALEWVLHCNARLEALPKADKAKAGRNLTHPWDVAKRLESAATYVTSGSAPPDSMIKAVLKAQRLEQQALGTGK